ncbi:MAG: T9SS type A sorting domain-containing protein [Bacteroidia bacterium]|nr:T9SS type A sorting domain-containing protein [Bacteroidia bacterium]MDW8235611.1 T9SS type A sorting domain-containing protein [Bacteroidia bacterium]
MRTLLQAPLALSLLWAQGTLRWNEIKNRLQSPKFHGISEETAPYARGSTLWVPESVLVQNAFAGSWANFTLDITRYDGFGRPTWDSSYSWVASQWELGVRTQYLRYRTGSFANWDSVIVNYNPANPFSRQHFFYTDLGGGRVRVEIRDSLWNADASRWELGLRTFVWTPRSRWIAQQAPDSGVSQVYVSGNFQDFYKQYFFFRNNRLDSTFLWINFRYLLDLPSDIYAGSYTLYSYDSQNRLIRERDTAWFISPVSGPAQGSWVWYFYQGSATRPFKDSSYSRDYGPSGEIDRRVTLYTYDSNGNLIREEVDTCTQANPGVCRDYQRTLYSYIRQQAPASLEAQVYPIKAAIPSLLRAGDRVLIETNYAAPYRVVDALGRLWDQGYLPAGESTLSLPLQSGLYIIQIGTYQQKVLLLP